MKIFWISLTLLASACAPVGKGESYSRPSVVTESRASRFEVITIDVTKAPGDTTPPRFDEVRVTAINHVSGSDDLVSVTIPWRGRGAGTFAIEGPSGVMHGRAVILPGNKIWFRDVTDARPISELMSRGLVFNETDPDLLKTVTVNWLNRVVAPAIEPHLAPALARP